MITIIFSKKIAGVNKVTGKNVTLNFSHNGYPRMSSERKQHESWMLTVFAVLFCFFLISRLMSSSISD